MRFRFHSQMLVLEGLNRRISPNLSHKVLFHHLRKLKLAIATEKYCQFNEARKSFQCFDVNR